ncbi:MAG: hypothetical protein WB439_11045, partial [Acidobacteriaceae bacterium]
MMLIDIQYPHELLRWLSADSKHVLYYRLFKIGSLVITPVFLIKGVGFLVVLIGVSRLLQRLV